MTTTATDTSRPRLLIVAGPNGAGKTTVTEAGLAHQWFAGCEYVNPQLVLRATAGRLTRQYGPERPWMASVLTELSRTPPA